MATRNQVLSLFGASPEQILEQRRREQAMDVLKQADPFQRAGSAIGVGLARMFGGEPAEVTRQRELYSQLEGVNFENPEQMRAAAASLQNQFPDRALQLLSLAEQSEARQQTIASSKAQQALAERQANEVTRKYKVTKKILAPLIPGGPDVVKTQEEFIDVKGTLNEDGTFKPYGGQLDFLQQQGVDVSPVDDLPKVDAEAVGIPSNTGVDIRRQPNGDYVIVNDDERIVRTLTEEEVKSLGGSEAEPVSSKPQQRKSQRGARGANPMETPVEPSQASASTTARGQMGRTAMPQVEEEEASQRSNRRRSNAR